MLWLDMEMKLRKISDWLSNAMSQARVNAAELMLLAACLGNRFLKNAKTAGINSQTIH
jgi:hypothetical protein